MRSYHENRGQGNIFILLCEGRAETITGGAAGEARKGEGNESFRETGGEEKWRGKDRRPWRVSFADRLRVLACFATQDHTHPLPLSVP